MQMPTAKRKTFMERYIKLLAGERHIENNLHRRPGSWQQKCFLEMLGKTEQDANRILGTGFDDVPLE